MDSAQQIHRFTEPSNLSTMPPKGYYGTQEDDISGKSTPQLHEHRPMELDSPLTTTAYSLPRPDEVNCHLDIRVTMPAETQPASQMIDADSSTDQDSSAESSLHDLDPVGQAFNDASRQTPYNGHGQAKRVNANMQMSRHNGLEVKDESFGRPAIFLTDYLDHSPEVRAKIRPDRYVHHPTSSNGGKYGFTAFLKPHQKWGCSKLEDLPKILFLSQKPDDHSSNAKNVGPMKVKCVNESFERLVLTSDRKLIKAWPDMPLICSPMIEGWRIEALLRLNPGCSCLDIHQRIVVERGNITVHSLQQRAYKARLKYKITSWNGRSSRTDVAEPRVPGNMTRVVMMENGKETFQDTGAEAANSEHVHPPPEGGFSMSLTLGSCSRSGLPEARTRTTKISNAGQDMRNGLLQGLHFAGDVVPAHGRASEYLSEGRRSDNLPVSTDHTRAYQMPAAEKHGLLLSPPIGLSTRGRHSIPAPSLPREGFAPKAQAHSLKQRSETQDHSRHAHVVHSARFLQACLEDIIAKNTPELRKAQRNATMTLITNFEFNNRGQTLTFNASACTDHLGIPTKYLAIDGAVNQQTVSIVDHPPDHRVQIIGGLHPQMFDLLPLADFGAVKHSAAYQAYRAELQTLALVMERWMQTELRFDLFLKLDADTLDPRKWKWLADDNWLFDE